MPVYCYRRPSAPIARLTILPTMLRRARYALVVGLFLARPPHTAAQTPTMAAAMAPTTGSIADPPEHVLDSLVAIALHANPSLRAAAARVDAAHARVGPAGARPDPMLMAGVLDFPYQRAGYADNFTMNMVRLTQTLPYPGKLSLATQAAQRDEASMRAEREQARLDVARDVKAAYYELAFQRQALEIVRRNADVLNGLIGVTQARYGVGTASQADVLRARVEATRLGDQAAVLTAGARAALARLNAVLDRPSATPVEAPAIPTRLARLAVADSAAHVHFTSAALGASAADSPLRPLDALVALAERESPMLQAHEARIAAQERRFALAEKAHLPDVDVSLEYDQRPHFSDYISVFVSVPLRLQRGRKQDQEVAEARATLAALHAEHVAEVSVLRQAVTTLVSDVERARTQLALAVSAVLPQARATLASATTNYQVGRVDFATVIDAQATVFTYETAYWRALTDFATSLANLERAVGAEVLR